MTEYHSGQLCFLWLLSVGECLPQVISTIYLCSCTYDRATVSSQCPWMGLRKLVSQPIWCLGFSAQYQLSRILREAGCVNISYASCYCSLVCPLTPICISYTHHLPTGGETTRQKLIFMMLVYLCWLMRRRRQKSRSSRLVLALDQTWGTVRISQLCTHYSVLEIQSDWLCNWGKKQTVDDAGLLLGMLKVDACAQKTSEPMHFCHVFLRLSRLKSLWPSFSSLSINQHGSDTFASII